MRYIRTSNNYVEFIEASDNGNILSTRGFQFGELYFQIKNGKVTFYLNDQENPWRNDVWTINIPFELDGVVYDNEDDASAVLHYIMNDRFQEQLDELRADLEEEIGRSTAMDEALQEEIDDERDRAISAETHLQTEVTELSGLVATFDERITQAEEDAAEALSAVTAEVIRSTAKDAEHDAAISGLTTGLNNEIQRAISAETEIANDLDAEITRSTAKDGQHDAQISALTTSLDNEIQRAIEAESGLRGDLDAEIANRLSGDTRLENLLNSEVARAISAETNLHDEILGEEARALAAESALSETLSSEIVRSTNKDTEHDDLISGLTDDGTSSLLQVDCGATEDGEPNGGHTSWHQQNTDAEFANATAAGNTCQEHAYERRPRNPPCPVEDGPARQPLTSGTVSGLSGATNHFSEVSQVVTNGTWNQVQDGHGRTNNEHEDCQQSCHDHVGVREVLNALAHARKCGQDKRQGQNQNDT